MVENSFIIKYGKVVSVEDDNFGLRIKARLINQSTVYKRDEDLPYLFPLLPKILHVNPKIGELVLIIHPRQETIQGEGFFIGPVISQPQRIFLDYYESAQSLLPGKQALNPLVNPNRNILNSGTLPEREDISIFGRGCTDIILKENETQIRCGHKLNYKNGLDNLIFNEKDLSYIQLKYLKYSNLDKEEEYKSVINVVADKINLLSHQSSDKFKLGERGSLLSDDELNNIMSKAHPLIFGDKLVDFLREFVKVFLNHEHKWAQLPPTVDMDLQLFLNEKYNKMDEMLSKSIKIN